MSVNLLVGHRADFVVADVPGAVEAAAAELGGGTSPLPSLLLSGYPTSRQAASREAHEPLAPEERRATTVAGDTGFSISASDGSAWAGAFLTVPLLATSDADGADDPDSEDYWDVHPTWIVDPWRDPASYYLCIALAIALARLGDGAILDDGYGYVGDAPVQAPEEVVRRLRVDPGTADPVAAVLARTRYSVVI